MQLRAPVSTILPQDQRAGSALATIDQVRNEINAIRRALRTPQSVEEFEVADTSGNMIFWAGKRVVGGTTYKGFWGKDGYLGGDDPRNAPVSIVDGVVTITLGGSGTSALEVKDGSGNVVVWAGKNGSDYGLWGKNVWIGGTGPSDAPFYSSGAETVIGNNGYVLLKDDTDAEVGWIGTRDYAGTQYSGGYFNQLYVGGDDATESPFFSDGTETVIGKNGFIVFKDTAEVEVGWIGTRTITAVDYVGGWLQEFRCAGPDTPNAKLVADATGVSLTDATITVTAGGTTITISPVDGIEVDAGTQVATLNSAYLYLTVPGSPDKFATYNVDQWAVRYDNSHKIEALAGIADAQITVTDGSSVTSLRGENIQTPELILGTPLDITYGGTGAGSAASALSNLGGTTLAAVQTWVNAQGFLTSADLSGYATTAALNAGLAGKANTSHSHSSISIASTSGGGVAAHTHTGTVS
jgi:hypothetical protein